MDIQENYKCLTWRLRVDFLMQIVLPRDFNRTDLERLNKQLELEIELTEEDNAKNEKTTT